MKQVTKCIGLLVAGAMVFQLAAPVAGVNAAAKPELSVKTVKINVGKTKKVKVKNVKGYKLSVKSKKKAIATAKKKGKNAFVVKGIKDGKTTVVCVVKKGKKKVNLNCKITVSDAKVETTAKPTNNPVVTTPSPTNAVVPTAAPTAAPIATPTATPTPTPTPYVLTPSETTGTIDPDDIKLRNVFREIYYADTLILPAEPDITFDEDVKMDFNQLTRVEMGTVSKKLGELTIEDVLSVGYTDAFGNEASIDERFEMIEAGSKDYRFSAYYDGNIIDRIHVLGNGSEEVSDRYKVKIPMKFTVFGIQIGDDAETLKQLGVPALVAQMDGNMYYYWQVETEEGGCCLCFEVTDNIISLMEIMIF